MKKENRKPEKGDPKEEQMRESLDYYSRLMSRIEAGENPWPSHRYKYIEPQYGES